MFPRVPLLSLFRSDLSEKQRKPAAYSQSAAIPGSLEALRRTAERWGGSIPRSYGRVAMA
jgi:hypothetical protein